MTRIDKEIAMDNRQLFGGGKGIDRTPHYAIAMYQYAKGIAHQACAWYLVADICSFDRTDQVIGPAQLTTLHDNELVDERPPLPRHRIHKEEDDYEAWQWLRDFGPEGIAFRKLVETWQTRFRQ